MPTICAPIPIRPSLRVSIAILYPSPTFPTTFSSGTSTSSNDRASVEEARMPSLSSFFPFPNPFQPDSTRKAVIPRYPLDRSTFAKMRKISASSPFVIQSLDPFRTQRSPFLAAVVARANASDPEPASESAYAPTFDFASCGRYLFLQRGARPPEKGVVDERVLDVDDDGRRGVHPGERLDDGDRRREIQAQPPELLGDLDPHQVEVEELPDEGGVHEVRPVHLHRLRGDLLDREPVDVLRDLALVVLENRDRGNGRQGRCRFCDGHVKFSSGGRIPKKRGADAPRSLERVESLRRRGAPPTSAGSASGRPGWCTEFPR